MNIGQAEGAVTSAIQQKRVVQVVYVTPEGTEATATVEPFDISRRMSVGEYTFWGWCRESGRMENYLVEEIQGIVPINETFDPKEREATLSHTPKYRIFRDW
jgi:predicted DNA-binding transcriptional regulator YafY